VAGVVDAGDLQAGVVDDRRAGRAVDGLAGGVRVQVADRIVPGPAVLAQRADEAVDGAGVGDLPITGRDRGRVPVHRVARGDGQGVQAGGAAQLGEGLGQPVQR